MTSLQSSIATHAHSHELLKRPVYYARLFYMLAKATKVELTCNNDRDAVLFARLCTPVYTA